MLSVSRWDCYPEELGQYLDDKAFHVRITKYESSTVYVCVRRG